MARILAIIEANGGVGRTLLRQVGMFGRIRGHQMMHVSAMAPERADGAPCDLDHYRPDAIIGMIRYPKWFDWAASAGVPVINSTVRLQNLPFPSIRFDDEVIGRLAAGHLLTCNYPHFAYVGIEEHAYSDNRLKGFQQALAEHDHRVHVRAAEQGEAGWDRFYSGLLDWVKQLPKPVGVLVCNDGFAKMVLAQVNGHFRVPQDLGVVGVDNDTCVCEFLEPPLTSVDPGPALLAKALLDGVERALAGEHLPHDHRHEPAGLVARGSTDYVVTDDPLARRAVDYIRNHATRRIDVGKVADHLGVSRRTLERAFADQIGRTPAAEIRRVQIATAKRLLVETDQLLADVAAQSGYEYVRHFTEVFKREVGQTPTEYRSRFVAS